MVLALLMFAVVMIDLLVLAWLLTTFEMTTLLMVGSVKIAPLLSTFVMIPLPMIALVMKALLQCPADTSLSVDSPADISLC